MPTIDDYGAVIGAGALEELLLLGERMAGKSVLNINSTAVGGGVAEILSRMIPLLRDVGVNAKWDVIKGDERFFAITKSIHNALHGVAAAISEDDFNYFVDTNRRNALEMDLEADYVFVHDPQPVALVERREKLGGHWLWRGHVDFSRPDLRTWNFLRNYVELYDAAVFSAPSFARELAIKQLLIAPSIDPLSDKNKELTEEQIDAVLQRFGIDRSRRIITQISRFDYLKDPVGVIK